jgi:shikimate kinase
MSDQPVAFDGVRRSQQVGVGRAGALDDADAAQKIDPAA